MMKVKAYLAAILIFNGFVSYNVQAIMGPKRWAQCAFRPGKYECTSKEKAYARKWLAGASVIVIATIVAGIGIKMTTKEIRESKEKAGREERAGKPKESVKAAGGNIQQHIKALRELAKEISNLDTEYIEISGRFRNPVGHMTDIYTLNIMRDPEVIKSDLDELGVFFSDNKKRMSSTENQEVSDLINKSNNIIKNYSRRNLEDLQQLVMGNLSERLNERLTIDGQEIKSKLELSPDENKFYWYEVIGFDSFPNEYEAGKALIMLYITHTENTKIQTVLTEADKGFQKAKARGDFKFK